VDERGDGHLKLRARVSGAVKSGGVRQSSGALAPWLKVSLGNGFWHDAENGNRDIALPSKVPMGVVKSAQAAAVLVLLY
jgi:hypothetical protein